MGWGGGRSELDVDAEPVQCLSPFPDERFEGLAFSSSGHILAVATADTNAVALFRRKPDGLFENAPYCRIGGADRPLHYPHDVAFSRVCDKELLAVAQRTGSIVVFEKNTKNETFGPQPAFEICGPRAGLAFSDGVAFVPPGNEHIAACNLTLGSVTFYRRVSVNPVIFKVTPEFELKHESLHHPDGLGFSRCGRWLAVANHGNHSVSIFRRRRDMLSFGKIKYGPRPVVVLKDPAFRHPHSVAFTPLTDHLVVTNAGANYFNAYQPDSGYFSKRWAQSPCCKKTVASNIDFRKTNDANPMEGGPKGIAVHQNQMAVCSPEIGIKIFSFRERAANGGRASAPY